MGCRTAALMPTVEAMTRAVFVALLVAVGVTPALAQPVTGVVKPIHHRALEVKPARGRIDPGSGVATITLNGWGLGPLPTSNGVFPDLEHIRIWIGEFNDFNIPEGALIPRRGGRYFTYKMPPEQQVGIQKLRIKPMGDGTFRFWVTLKHTSLAELVIANPQCINFTFVIGDDDGFDGVNFLRRGRQWFDSRRVFVDTRCEPIGSWPGL